MREESDILELLIELQALDRVPRVGYALRGIASPESVSEHCFHLAFMVWALAREEPAVDTLRAVELALVHDLAEVRTGDLPRTVAHHLPEGAKSTMERAVAAELLAALDSRSDGPSALDLFDEYQAKSTPEARFVKACDELQVRIKALTYARAGARGLGEFWDDFDTWADALPFSGLRRLAQTLSHRRPDG